MNESALTPFAWFFMLGSMLSVTILVIYCYKRILFDDHGQPDEELRAPSPGAPAGG